MDHTATIVKYPVIVILVFLWIGFVCAISFMEAWLKFRAPGVTVPIGLSIGKLVFGALNKIEWILAIAIGLSLLFGKNTVWISQNIYFAIPLLLLLLQTVWLLPALDERARQVIQGMNVASSKLHIYFVAFELIKVASLAVFGISMFHQIK
jgi:hypothetical protein